MNTPREGRLSFLEISTVSELLICSTPPISSKKWPRKATSGAFAVAGFRWNSSVFGVWASRRTTPENAAQTHKTGGFSGDALGVHLHSRSHFCLKSKSSVFNGYRLYLEYGMKVQNQTHGFCPLIGASSFQLRAVDFL